MVPKEEMLGDLQVVPSQGMVPSLHLGQRPEPLSGQGSSWPGLMMDAVLLAGGLVVPGQLLMAGSSNNNNMMSQDQFMGAGTMLYT